MSILVTGGAGYIGSHCVKALLKVGEQVIVLDDLSTGHRELVLTPDFIQGSTTDKSLLTKIFKQYPISAVMHFAASAYVGESVENPEKYYYNNIYGTLQLLSAMRENKIQQFIFSSTCAVYGTPESLPIREDHRVEPVSPYGYTKHVVERMLADFAQAYAPLRYVIFRYFNAAGADPEGQLGECHDPETHLIPLILQAACGKRSEITIYGTDYPTPDGTCIRDYIHILDIAQAHLLALRYLESGGKTDIFQIVSETGFSVREIIDACRALTGKTFQVNEGPRRPGDPAALVASSQKLRTALGWKPEFETLEPIIETAWNWEQRRIIQ